MIFKRFTDKILIINIFGKTTVNITVDTKDIMKESNHAGEHPHPSHGHVPIDNKICPVCNCNKCICEESGDGNFVL